jgi:hypothetical protein
LVLLALAALGGCREEPQQGRTAAQYQRLLDSSGKRVLVVDGAGQPVAKLRERSHKYKVYEADLTPVGFVSWESTEAGTVVAARSIENDDARAIEQVSENTFELGAELRIEQTDRGWAVFGPNAQLAGVFERGAFKGGGPDTWSLRRSYDDAALIRATSDGTRWSLTQDGRTIIAVQAGELPALELLSLELDTLSTLHQVAVGVWMERARPN